MQPNHFAIYQTEQIRAAEILAATNFQLTPSILMARAGKAALTFIQEHYPNVRTIHVFCGGGNNGGDGYVFAKLGADAGLKIHVWQIGIPDERKPEAFAALKSCQEANIPMHAFDTSIEIEAADLIIDAICGIGMNSRLSDNVVQAVNKINQAQVPVLAIDVPTGVNADTGEILGAAVKATHTISFIALKVGLLTGSGIAYAGEVAIDDLQLPAAIFSEIQPVAERISGNQFKKYLKPRPRDWHKGLSGHVLVIGGEFGYAGAPRMAAEAALRVGAGLVSVATQPENALMMNTSRPEIMCHGLNYPEELRPLLEKADVVILGPGLGQTKWSSQLWQLAIDAKLPIVVDADGLNLLAKQNALKNMNWILTPHPGEAARLLQTSVEGISKNRLAAAKNIQINYGGTCVLKGAGSIVSSENGVSFCMQGNPGMATAGMGDVLSGVIGGLWAQGIPAPTAAQLGVLMHASAGDLAAKDGQRGMLAMDLMPYLRYLANPYQIKY